MAGVSALSKISGIKSNDGLSIGSCLKNPSMYVASKPAHLRIEKDRHITMQICSIVDDLKAIRAGGIFHSNRK